MKCPACSHEMAKTLLDSDGDAFAFKCVPCHLRWCPNPHGEHSLQKDLTDDKCLIVASLMNRFLYASIWSKSQDEDSYLGIPMGASCSNLEEHWQIMNRILRLKAFL